MAITNILCKSFEQWMKTLGYAPCTVYLSAHYADDFMQWLEKSKTTKLENTTSQTIHNYYQYLQQRLNKRGTGGLSEYCIMNNITSLRRFSRYLQQTGKPYFEINLQLKAPQPKGKIILTKQEIQALYMACTNDYLGIRDRAMLSIFYGCGLRRNEGVNLDLKDILLKEKRVYVRKGKNYKQRYVPMAESIKQDLENYIHTSREKLLSFKNRDNNRGKMDAFFISREAGRIGGTGIIARVQNLAAKAGIQKQVGIHTLRHSIATHLLQSGLSLEEVRCFLGHASLESTQIYTHVAAETE